MADSLSETSLFIGTTSTSIPTDITEGATTSSGEPVPEVQDYLVVAGGEDKPKRTYITDGQRTILKQYWDGGLKSYGTREKRDEVRKASKETGLEETVIKNWINNGNKAEKIQKKLYTRSKPMTLNPKKTSAHKLFIAEFFKNKDMSTHDKRKAAMKGAPEAWIEVQTDTDKLSDLKTKADKINKEREKKQPPGVRPTCSSKQRKALARRTTQKIGAMCSKLEEKTSFNSVFMASHHTDGVTHTGSSFGCEYAAGNNEAEVLSFHYAAGGDRCVERKLSRNKMKQSVIQLFNMKYKEATGKNRVEYDLISSGKSMFVIKGLPEGISFDKPGAYGHTKLQRILLAKDLIQFTAREMTDDVTSSAQAESLENETSQPTDPGLLDEDADSSRQGGREEIPLITDPIPIDEGAGSSRLEPTPLTAVVLLNRITSGIIDEYVIEEPRKTTRGKNKKTTKKNKKSNSSSKR